MKKFIIFLILIPILLYARFIEPARLTTIEKVLTPSAVSENLAGLKMVIVSDLHIGCKFVSQEKLKKIVNLINNQNPDLIFLLGDFDSELISASKISEKEIANILGNLKAKIGCYAVLGNHDYSNPDMIRRILAKSKIKLLEDSSDLIEYNSKKIRIIGLKDLWHSGYNRDFVKSFNEENIILLSHNPDIFPELPNNIDLTFSGHTHGGEIRFPFLGAIFIPSKYNQKYGKGFVVENNKNLYVTSGVGTLSRLRFFNPPEVVVISLSYIT